MSIDMFQFQTDVHNKPITKSMGQCHLVPLVRAADEHSAVLVQLSGGGTIPASFGIEDKIWPGGRRSVTLALKIESEAEHAALDRLRGDVVEVAERAWGEWYPDTAVPASDRLATMCRGLVTARKPKQDGLGEWPGVAKCSIVPLDCDEATGNCKIVDRDTEAIVPFEQLPGMSWHKAIFELRYIYIQNTQSYGLSKKLRFLLCSEGEQRGEAVSI